ncbi:MAG: TolC family protein [Bryobacteraceae bacterium]|nr:TolC family protein [Bryobacteraceae bacterium]
MKTVQSIAAILCALLMAAPAGLAQQYSWQHPEHSWVTDPYRAKTISPVNLTNTERLERLVRAGRLYLSLNDAIALALENNLDIEIQRYGPQIARADLMRAEAGGLLRGVPQSVTQGAASVEAQVTGTAAGTSAGVRTSGSGGGGQDTGTTATEAGGAIITQTGVATPVLDPRFFFRYAFSHRSTPQSNTITTGGVSSFVFDNHAGNMGFEQNWLTGTTASFGWNSNYSQSNNLASALNPFFSSNWQLQISQRLLQGFGRAVNNRNIRIAKNNLHVTDLVFEQQVIATVASVVKLYWDLVSFTEDVKVKQQALALAEKLYNDNKKQVEIGTLAPIEIVSAQAQVARRQQELTASETRLLQQETVLKNSLSKNGVESPMLSSARVIATDRINIPPQEPLQPIADLVDTAMVNRREVEQTQVNIENTRIGMAGSRSALLPSLDAIAFFNNNALAGEPNFLHRPGITQPADPYFVGGFGSNLGQLLRRNFPDYGIAFQLSIPIRNRSAQSDYIRDSLQLRQQELRERSLKNNIRVQVQNAQIAVMQARALYDAAVQERILQEQTLEAEQKKYALGASTVFFVIQYQRDLAQAQSNEVAALATYAKARVDLDQSLGLTLRTHNIQIDEAKAGRVSRPPDPIPALQQ